MSPSPLTARSARLRRDERGFTLIEVMVAMVVGLIVIGALFAILEVSLKQNARITDRVQSAAGRQRRDGQDHRPAALGMHLARGDARAGKKHAHKLIFTTAFSESHDARAERSLPGDRRILRPATS